MNMNKTRLNGTEFLVLTKQIRFLQLELAFSQNAFVPVHCQINCTKLFSPRVIFSDVYTRRTKISLPSDPRIDVFLLLLPLLFDSCSS